MNEPAATGSIVSFVLLCIVVLTAAVIDYRTELTPNWLTLPAILLGLIWWTLWGAIFAGLSGAGQGLALSGIGLASALIPFAIIYAMGGLGGGDVKLMTAVGALTASWQVVLATSFYALIIAAVMAVFVMIRQGLVRRTFSRIFGVALMKAAKVKADIPDDSPHIPFAVAVALGAILAGVEILLNVHTPWRAM